MNIYKLKIDDENDCPDYGFLDFIIVAENIDKARVMAYNESDVLAYGDENWLDRSVVSCKKIGICTDESIKEPVILASSFTND